MYYVKEFHTDVKRLADLLLWGGLVHGPCATAAMTWTCWCTPSG